MVDEAVWRRTRLSLTSICERSSGMLVDLLLGFNKLGRLEPPHSSTCLVCVLLCITIPTNGRHEAKA